ncbi:helix-turn-helix transcriptional regulator [Actinokineospora sp. NBRC 105648]|uniref:helix-turn-helix domain-containing protein n=1 Tax=Actinokineospora sp. NBRC 105648 TaxID=3032206 RepID=UPI0024A29D6C|nr:helix-turn-helix transcriptional regulator [Actinokineospora sp. NBRC 105648]GLZ41809.1 transcriptional regulator [Actinokineospora sp. NBRC 105648]
MRDLLGELAGFLRTRRERLTPGDVGLPVLGRVRRTPGLRREEVADLAGVSVDYLTRLEQGRGLRPSAEVLAALGRALRLDLDERDYMFALAGQRSAAERRTPDPGPLARLVHDLAPLPALLIDHRFDLVAWNPQMARLMLDFDTLPDAQHNALLMCLTHPAFRDFYRDRERVLSEAIADLRAAWAAHPDDAELSALVDELSRNDEFERLWDRQDVRVNGRGRKPLLHPGVGPVTVDFEVLNPLHGTGHRLIVYRAADPASQSALDSLAEGAGPAHPLRAVNG